MPLTEKGRKILRHMEMEYGEKKGRAVFYAARNKGRITGVEQPRKPAAQRQRGGGPAHA